MKTNQQVLIADDDPVYRQFLESSITKWGYPVRTTSDGEEALRCLLTQHGPKVAIVDWNMPKLDGLGVCRSVRERYTMSDVFILVLTSRGESNDLAQALDAGANDYVTKPFDCTELKARLEMGQRLVGSIPALADSQAAARISWTHDETGFITPIFDPRTLKFSYGVSATLLRAWTSDGTLQKVLLDRVQVCPQCFCVPTFRFGCSACGSGCVTNDRMIHHFACAHVGPATDFDDDGELVCPKCRVRRLVVGADFEHLTGPYHCLDCDWSDVEVEHVAQCLGCGFRFPADQAVFEDLVGYYVHQLDLLGAVPSPD